MVRAHLDSGAIATIAAMTRAPDEVAEKYGVMLVSDAAKVSEFAEKPTLAELREHFHVHTEEEFRALPLLTNAGFYLVDTARLRGLASHPDVLAMRERRLDFGKDLLPWLVEQGQPVHAFPVRRIGDLGSVADFLETMIEVLHGNFAAMDRQLGLPFDAERNVWIAPESLSMRDEATGTTLADKLLDGSVSIGPAVRIGRFCEIGPGVTISESNLDDDVEVRAGARIERAQVRDGAIVGAGARLRDVVVGSMTEVRSELDLPTEITELVALGDEVTVHAGVHLSGGISVYPRLKIPGGIQVPEATDITGPADVLRYL
jgi:NDP-sugar pyrophosphorylase family protein